MDVRIFVISGPLAGQTVPLPQGKFVIGRQSDCHLILDSEFASHYHCVLLLDEWTLRIRDLGSKNGTAVNGHRVGTHEFILIHGDLVTLGDTAFCIESDEADLGSGSLESDSTDVDAHAPVKESSREE